LSRIEEREWKLSFIIEENKKRAEQCELEERKNTKKKEVTFLVSRQNENAAD